MRATERFFTYYNAQEKRWPGWVLYPLQLLGLALCLAVVVFLFSLVCPPEKRPPNRSRTSGISTMEGER